MVREITGPELLRRVRYHCFNGAGRFGHAKYTYVDGHGRRTPAYAAAYIKITAFYVVMSDALVDQLVTEIGVLPGCRSVTKIVGHPTLRPQAVAIFDRAAAVPA